MKVVDCRGTRRRIGETIGESLRDEIRAHIAEFVQENRREEHYSMTASFEAAIRSFLPHLLEEMGGIAAGAGVAFRDILALNLPWVHVTDPAIDQECSNLVINHGPDGPLWGKNNEGAYPPGPGRRPVCLLRIYPDDGIPALCFTFCGWLSGGDMMNAEGLAAGHSSVGSRFMQSRRHVPVLLWLYEGMFRCRSAGEFARHTASLPGHGKGFAMAVVDQSGEMLSLEIACPLTQVRRPMPGEKGLNCVNRYQLPLLAQATNRTPQGLANAAGRQAFLERAVVQGDGGIEHMQRVLRHHGEFSICRHGGADLSHTEYSMIGVPRQNKALFLSGYPCEEEYREVMI